MKRKLIPVSFLILTVILSSRLYASTVKMGFYSLSGMMNGAGEGQAKSGYAYDYIQEIASYAGWNYEYVYGSFNDLYEKLVSGEIDMLPYISKSADREKDILFPKIKMGEEQFYLAALKEGQLSDSLSELNGKKVGTMKGAYHIRLFNALAREKGINCQIVEYTEAKDRWNALQNGLVDYTIETSTVFQGIELHAVYELTDRAPYYLGVARGRNDLLEELETAEENIQIANPGYLENLKLKYFVGIPLFKELPPESSEWLKTHKRIIIGSYDNDVPYVIQNEDGSFTGIACDQVDLMRKALGVKQPVEYRLYPGRKEALAALKAGEIDCINPYYHGYADAEKDGVIISQPVYSSDFSVLYRGVYTDETLAKIATPDTRLGASYVRDHYPNAEIVPCQNGYDCIEKLDAGLANSVVMYTDALQEIASKYRKKHVIKNLTADCPVCVAALPEDFGLICLVNKAIPFVSELEMSEIHNRYSIEKPSISLHAFVNAHPECIYGTIAILAVIALVVSYFANRRRKVFTAKVEENEFLKTLMERFTSDYDAVILGDLNDASYRIISHKPEFDEIFTGKNTMISAIDMFINRGVYSADRERIDKTMIHFDEVKKKLAIGESNILEYRSAIENGYVWYSANLTRIGENEILVGFKECDDEMLDRQVTEKLIGDYEALYVVDLEKKEIRPVKKSVVSDVGNFVEKKEYEKTVRIFASTVDPKYKDDWLRFSDVEYMKEYMAKENHREYVYELPEAGQVMRRFSVDVLERVDGEASILLFSFMGIDDERAQTILLHQQMAEQKVLLDYFVHSYSAAYFINLADDTFEILHLDPEAEKRFNPERNSRSDMVTYINEYIHPDDRAVVLQHIDKKYLKKALKKDPIISFIIREQFDGQERVMRMLIVRGSDVEHVAVGFMDITDELGKEKANQTKLEEALTFTNYFLDTYVSAYYVDLDTLEYQVYKRTADLERDYPILENYFTSLSDYINTAVHPDDRDALLKVTEPQKMKQLLMDHTEYSHIFRDISGGIEKIYKMQVIRGTDRNHAAYGFVDITDVLREQQKSFLGAVSLSKDILGKANVGLWAFELDEGLPPRMYVDDTMLGLIGLTHQVSPEETYHAWYDHIDEGSYDLVNDAVAKMVNGDHAEVQYPWHHPDGHTMIVRCGGVLNPDYIAGVRIEGTHQNVTEVLHYDEEEVERLKRTAIELQHEQLRSEVLNYMVNNPNDDPVELLKAYAERLRELINCDQVIYRDLEETRIMVNSDGIAENWSVPIEYCQQCQHFNAHHPMYARGYTEMENCQEGWQGIPVYHDCPIKSSLTRIIYCDGETAGYLAIHYVQDYHRFSDIERNTLEEFARILSMSLSRYKAKLENREMKRYNLLHEIIHSGKWSIFVDADNNVVKADFSDSLKPIINNDFTDDYQSWLNLVHPDDVEAVKNGFRNSIGDKTCNTPYDVTYRMRDREGEYHWFHAAGRIVRDENGNGELFGIHINITDQIDEQIKQQRQLEEALSMAQSANRAKTTFLNNMSHDIRTPMNAIMGFTELAEKHIDEKELIQDYLAKISQSSDHLLSLINDVLDMSRIESGKMFISEKEEDLGEIIEALKDIVQADVKAKKLNFKVETSGLKNTAVFCDKLRLNQVLLNVLSNSIKYTENGGNISMTVTEKSAANKKNTTYEFRIKDNGIGMSKEFLATIFDPFTRVKSSTVSGIQGTGLGMSITKNLVDMMAGEIDVQSEEGKGTEVTMTFDFKLQEKTSGAKAGETEKTSEIELAGKKILLVDDNDYNREIAVEILEDYDIKVFTAIDGSVAVEMIKSSQKGDFDLILMDVQMPVMDGYEATRQIRALGTELSKIPILAMTANAFEEDRKLALEAGMNDHIPKPIQIDVLKQVLSKYL